MTAGARFNARDMLTHSMRKVLLTALILVVMACAVAMPIALSSGPLDSHCVTLSTGLYVGLHAGTVSLLALLVVTFVARYSMGVAVRRTAAPNGWRPIRRMPNWIPHPVLLAAAAVDDPQIFDRRVVVSWLRASA